MLVANVAGLFLQSCLYEWHGVARGDHAVFPVNYVALLLLSMLLMFEQVSGTS